MHPFLADLLKPRWVALVTAALSFSTLENSNARSLRLELVDKLAKSGPRNSVPSKLNLHLPGSKQFLNDPYSIPPLILNNF